MKARQNNKYVSEVSIFQTEFQPTVYRLSVNRRLSFIHASNNGLQLLKNYVAKNEKLGFFPRNRKFSMAFQPNEVLLQRLFEVIK